MDDETQKIITEQMKNLPADVKAAILSVDYKTKLQEVTKRQRLLIDQAGKLEMEVTLIMIGLEPLNDFVENIEKEFGVNTIRAREIAMDVNENIFKPIRASLHKMNDEMLQTEEGGPEANIQSESATETETDEALDREKILNEIENPISNRPSVPVTEKQIEIRPVQTPEIIPGEPVRDITKEKLTAPVISQRQIVQATPEIKLPELDKKRPSSGVDPYREPIS